MQLLPIKLWYVISILTPLFPEFLKINWLVQLPIFTTVLFYLFRSFSILESRRKHHLSLGYGQN